MNGNIGPSRTSDTHLTHVAEAFNQLATKLLKICNTAYGDFKCINLPDTTTGFPLPPAEAFEIITDYIRTNSRFHFTTTVTKEVFKFPVGYIYSLFNSVRMSGNSADWLKTLDTIKALLEWVHEIVKMPSDHDAKIKVSKAISAVDLSSEIPGLPQGIYSICGNDEWSNSGICGQYWYYSPQNHMSTVWAINGLDYAHRFSWLQTAQLTEFLRQKYPDLAVYSAINDCPIYMMYPLEPTPCVYGFRSGIKGIVINSLYDGATRYVNAKTMREGMSSTVLVTWQGIGHCVNGYNDYDAKGVQACLRKVDEYFQTHGATLPIDGFTCRNSRQIVAAEKLARER